MCVQLTRQSYEKLIKQLIFIDENQTEIGAAAQEFVQPGSRRFLKDYIRAVESILADIEIVEYNPGAASLPFVLIGSDFVLTGQDRTGHDCHITADLYEQPAAKTRNIYAFSEIGLELLMKTESESCVVNLGHGWGEYTVHSIRMS